MLCYAYLTCLYGRRDLKRTVRSRQHWGSHGVFLKVSCLDVHLTLLLTSSQRDGCRIFRWVMSTSWYATKKKTRCYAFLKIILWRKTNSARSKDFSSELWHLCCELMFFVPIVLPNLFFVCVVTCAILADTCVVSNGFRMSYLTCNSHCTMLLRHFLRRVRKIGKSGCYLSVRPSVRPSVLPSEWNNSAPTGWIFREYKIWVLFENLSIKI